MTVELGILGAGNMAEAIAQGMMRSGLLKPEEMLASDVSPVRRRLFAEELGIPALDDNVEVASRARAVLLSVKPQQMAQLLSGIEAAGAARDAADLHRRRNQHKIHRRHSPSANPRRIGRRAGR